MAKMMLLWRRFRIRSKSVWMFIIGTVYLLFLSYISEKPVPHIGNGDNFLELAQRQTILLTISVMGLWKHESVI